MIGDRFKEIRKNYGDTQQHLADKLQVSKSTIQSREQEKSSPNHDLLVAICRLYNTSADFLLGLKEDDPIFLIGRSKELTPENVCLLKRFEEFLLTEQTRNERR